jgi:hypothetical protein
MILPGQDEHNITKEKTVLSGVPVERPAMKSNTGLWAWQLALKHCHP